MTNSVKMGEGWVVITRDNCPSNCGSWSGETQTGHTYNFSSGGVLWDDSHNQFRLYQCMTCKTWYLWHWHEEIDWVEGDDSSSMVAISITDADVIAIKYFRDNAPNHQEYLKFLQARIAGFWANLKWE